MKLVLGSASLPRRDILQQMGYTFSIARSNLDEKAIRDQDPCKLVLKLALAKAEALKDKVDEDSILITSDILMTQQGKVLEKPSSLEEAYQFIKGYSEGFACAFAAVVVTDLKSGRQSSGIEKATAYFQRIPDVVVESLVKRDFVLDCSGAIQIEDPILKPYIIKIDGEIETFMGLPRLLTEKLIKEVKS